MEVGEVIKRGGDFFFFFFFFFAFHFWKRRKFVLVYQNGNFLPGKSQEKLLCPLRKICLLRPCLYCDPNETDFLTLLTQDGPSKYDVIDAHAWGGMVSWPGC